MVTSEIMQDKYQWTVKTFLEKQFGSDKGLSYDSSLVECMLSRQLKRYRESVLHLEVYTTHIKLSAGLHGHHYIVKVNRKLSLGTYGQTMDCHDRFSIVSFINFAH